MEVRVFVIDYYKRPLMPCSPATARRLLDAGKAKVWRRTPFTIKLNYVPKTRYMQTTTVGLDTGSSEVGSAVVDENNKVLYMSQITIRNDISKKMDQRRSYRRTRRNRKTRYRPARWRNRKNSIKKDRFSPTMLHKFDAHLKELDFIASILPIHHIIIEGGQFDPHALKDPSVLKNKWKYQRGELYGFENVKSFVRERDDHKCQHCKGKTKDSKLEVHHIVPRSKQGSDEPSNLITLCKTCHDKVHLGEINLKKNGRVKSQRKHATQMNSIRIQLLRRVPEAEETFGYITKVDRIEMGLPKTHYYDAVAIASRGEKVNFVTDKVLRKRCVSKGDYKQTKGIRSHQKMPTGKIHGFRKFDKVLHRGNVYFIKGKMSTGYAFLMDIDNSTKLFTNPIMPKFSNMLRLEARKSWFMIEQDRAV